MLISNCLDGWSKGTRHRALSIALISVIAVSSASTALSRPSKGQDLIPRSLLFGTDTYSEVQISPDGKWISYFKPVDGVNNIWIAPFDQPKNARVLTSFGVRGPDSYRWSADSGFMLVLKDSGGEELTQISSVNVQSGAIRDLTGDRSLRTTIVRMSADRPGIALFALNARDHRYPDLYEVNLANGARKQVLTNNGRFTSFVAAPDLTPRIGVRIEENGSATYEILDKQEGRRPLLTLPLEDLRSSKMLGLGKTGVLRMLDSRGSDKANLVSVDVATGRTQKLADAISADIVDVLSDPVSGGILATREDALVGKWTARTPEAASDIDAIERALQTPFKINGQTPDNKKWIIQSVSGKRPDQFSIWDREEKKLTLLFSAKPQMESMPLATTSPVIIQSRDGQSLRAYLTLPAKAKLNAKGKPLRPLPMVLLVHGGPWLRDTLRFDERAQWLADRGYASLAVNFRGSTGFGKAFISAADRQWSGAMHNDLIDAVNWAFAEGFAERKRTAIYGLSYGGYSTLVGLSFTPGVFACGVDLAGPSNLGKLFTEMPDWWEPQLGPQFRTRVNDPRTEKGLADLMRRSPVTRSADIRAPLLVTNGENDPRIRPSQSNEIVNLLSARKHPVTYVYYPDEGHVYEKQKTSISFHAVAEQFLSKCLGGRAEPIGKDLDGSAIEVKTGAAFIPRLPAALKSMR